MKSKWLKGLAAAVVAAVAIHLGIPAPIATQLGNEAAGMVGD